ncbi:HAD-IA family hydrolase [bacterium]|nr:HAD-IA family hydrolase [bacterium]
MAYQAVMFDLDGTLVDSLADLANAVNHALITLGCPTHPLAAYRQFVGDGARALCVRALPADREDLVEETVRLMREHYEAHWSDLTHPYPGILALVGALRQRGLRLAVLSNKPDGFTKQIVTRYFPGEPFHAVRGQLSHLPLKPDPTTARQIAAELGVPPGQWLYLGDTNTDMRTAHAAGMHAVGVLWGFRDRAELEDSGAADILTEPGELLGLLDSQNSRS